MPGKQIEIAQFSRDLLIRHSPVTMMGQDPKAPRREKEPLSGSGLEKYSGGRQDARTMDIPGPKE